MLIKAVFILISMISAMFCQQSLAQTTAQEWIDQGFTLYSQGKYDASFLAFDRAIALDHDNADAWYNKGVILFDQGKINDSLQAFNRSIGINPLDADAWYNKGSALAALGRSTEANDAFLKASKLEAFISADESASEDRELTTGNSIVEEIESGTYEDWLNRGNALYDQTKYEEAIQAYNSAIELDPQEPKAWRNKGHALNKLGKNSEANECFWRATGLKGGYAFDRKLVSSIANGREWIMPSERA